MFVSYNIQTHILLYGTWRYLEVFVTGTLHCFGNDNSDRRMYCSSIGIVIGNGNIIMFWFGQWRYSLQVFHILLDTIILTVICDSGGFGRFL